KTDIYNQHKQKVTTGIAKVKIIEQEIPQEQEIEEKEQPKKVALVIGGTGGIGRVTCLQLAKDGFDIAVHYYKNDEQAKKIKKEIEKLEKKSIMVKADITKDTQVKEMIECVVRKLETITVLVNCATAKIPNIKFAALAWEDIQNHIDINIKGSFNLLKYVVPVMEIEKYGKIINISTQAVETPNPEWLHYITAKSALNGFSKALAAELAPKGIRVNVVSPGMTDTELISDIPEKVRLLTAAKTPLRRIAKPDDIADSISFLASNKSDFITGATIRVNGGQVMV
ncbi:SDR family NAD(P)-dependent oxidoreductase, partial [Candidatus Omnitrophota bacterium]